MARVNDVLVRIGRGEGELCERLRALGFPALAVARTSRLRALLTRADRSPRAVLIGTDLPSSELEAVLSLLGDALDSGDTTGVVVGEPPDAERLARFQEAGFSLALYKPIDTSTLRFQVNRAFLAARSAGPARCELRVPLDWAVGVRVGERSKSATLYNLSPGGAFLETSRPSLRGVALQLDLPLPSGEQRVEATVMYTNVPGNLKHALTPFGMGVRFAGLSNPVARELAALVTHQSEALLV